MPSNYPTGLDAFTTGTLTGVVSGSDHGNKADAINKVEAELGLSPSGSATTVAARLASLAVSVKDHGAVGDGTTDDTAAFTAAISAAGATQAVFVPEGTYKITSVVDLPSGTTIRGMGYRTVLKSTAAASTTFTFFRNTGWAASTPANDIYISGIRFRRETVLAGDEASYSNHINLRRVTNAVVKDCIFEGNEGGVGMEACLRFKVVDCFGYRQSDVSFRINWSGSDGPGAPPAQLGLVEGCWAAENGYQLGDGSVVPAGIPIGSSFLCTQSDVTFRNCGSVDPKVNSFECGAGATGIVIDGLAAEITVASRTANVLIADCADVDIRGVRAVVRAAGGGAKINVEGAVGTAQTNITISDCTGKNYVTEGVEKTGINIVDRSTFVTIQNCVYDGMRMQIGSATSTSDILVENCEVRNCERHGYYFQSSARVTGKNLRAINNGVNTANWAPTAEYRGGFVLDTLGADSAFSDMESYDTRAGGSRTQTYGWYLHASTVAWERNVARNNITAALFTTGTVVTYPLTSDMLTVASATALTLGPTSTGVIKVSGTTTITSVVATGWAGRQVTLIFEGALTFTDGSNLKLSANLVSSADDTITLVCDGTNWFETARSVN